MILCALLFTLAVLLITIGWLKSNNMKKKMEWVEIAPAIPIIGNALDFRDSTKTLNSIHKLALKYDGLCYVELLLRPLLFISNYNFLEWLLQSNTVLTKGKDYQYVFRWLGHGILITDGDNWRRSRKILTPAFHFGILEQFVEIFDKPISVLIKLLAKEAGKDSVDIYPLIRNFGLDLICETTMGVQMNAQEKPNTDYVTAVKGMCRIIIERAFNPLKMMEICYYLSIDHLREIQYVKTLHKVSKEVISQRRKEISLQEQNEKRDDDVGGKKKMAFLDLMLKFKDDNGRPLTDEFIREQVDTFMFAGHDTTSSALSFQMYCLANHPDVQKAALAEIREVMGDRQKITYRDLQDMKYLELVIKESLRLYPSVPFYSRQTTEDVIYEENKVIPKGLTLVILAYTINRDPGVWDNPDEFIPTRFLDKPNRPFSYLPFSAGPRNCIGQRFAMLEMKSTLAKILLNFALLPAIPEHKVILAAETVLISKNGVKIRLKKRSEI